MTPFIFLTYFCETCILECNDRTATLFYLISHNQIVRVQTFQLKKEFFSTQKLRLVQLICSLQSFILFRYIYFHTCPSVAIKKRKGEEKKQETHTNFTLSFSTGQVLLVFWCQIQRHNCFSTFPSSRFHHKAKHHHTYNTSVKHIWLYEYQ